MKKYSLFFFASIITAPSFAIDTVQKATPFTNAPWCHIPCIKIRYIVGGILIGTIILQLIMLYSLPRIKKLKKWQKYILYGVITTLSIITTVHVLPPYLENGFIIGRCFLNAPMGCE